MNSSSEIRMASFRVDDDIVKNSGIIMEEAIMKPDSDCIVTLVLHKSASHPVYLKGGQLLEVVQEMSEEVADETLVRALQVVDSHSESVQYDCYNCSLETLNLKTNICSHSDCLKLKDLLTELRSEYWQVKMVLESVEYTVFMTHSGLYEYVVMSFGLCNTPSTFND